MTPGSALTVCVHDSLEDIYADEWNALSLGEPFLSHAFLVALERNGCVGHTYGWYPKHLAVRNAQGMLCGAMPLYLKTNSYGEFVFDSAWAHAYTRTGLSYYPKLVCAIPYTPVTGSRLLIHPTLAVSGTEAERIRQCLIDEALTLAREHRLSSVHWLFTLPQETPQLAEQGLMLRMGCQYHWHNAGYTDFDDFLTGFVAHKRKKLKRERARMAEQGITLRAVQGDALDAALWPLVHGFYTDTFDRKWGIPTLNLEFFKEIGRTLGTRIVLILAEHQGEIVACAINFRSNDTLYGRFWGCKAAFHSLHFETCYYQGIEYCIQQGLQRFEPGAQGEHKISRGFLPTPTWSAHWTAHPQFSLAIADFCRRERQMMAEECQALFAHSPFREDAIPPTQRPASVHEDEAASPVLAPPSGAKFR